jgi:hypothetical protein
LKFVNEILLYYGQKCITYALLGTWLVCKVCNPNGVPQIPPRVLDRNPIWVSRVISQTQSHVGLGWGGFGIFWGRAEDDTTVRRMTFLVMSLLLVHYLHQNTSSSSSGLNIRALSGSQDIDKALRTTLNHISNVYQRNRKGTVKDVLRRVEA